MRKFPLFLIFIWFLLPAFSQQVYFPPEFDKQEGLLLTWDYNDSRNPVTAAIAKAVQPSAKVWIIYYPGTAPMDTTEIRNYLRDHGVPDEDVFLIPAWSETLWIRDYGPFSVYENSNGTMSRKFIDAGYSSYGRPKDDSIPTQMANYFNIPVEDFNLQFEGGNILTDGLGRAWGSTRIFSQNPGMTGEEIKLALEERFGLDDMMFLQALVNSGGGIWCHVDMFMKILDNETILISEYPDFVPDYNLIESFVDTLSKMTNANGRSYQIVRIPAPPKANGTWATTQNDEMRTYTNSIIINDVVVVPSYDLPEYDSAARHIYEQHMPGYRIEMVDARPLTPLYGALHCIVKEVSNDQYHHINHIKLTGMQEFSENVDIFCNIFANEQPDSAWLFYRFKNEQAFNKTALAPDGPDAYFATLAGLSPADTIEYYLYSSVNGDEVVSPPPAPNGWFTFWFDPSVGIRHTSENPASVMVFPNPSNGNFLVSTDESFVPGKISIINMYGKTVFSGQVKNSNFRIDLNGKLDAGIYSLICKKNKNVLSVRKIIIHK